MTEEPALVLAAVRAKTGLAHGLCRILWAVYSAGEMDNREIAARLGLEAKSAQAQVSQLRANTFADWTRNGERWTPVYAVTLDISAKGRVAIKAILVQMRDESLAAMANHA